MKRLTAVVFAACVALGAATVAARAARVTPLAQVAASLGFTYSYLGPEDAVALSRAGVTIVIRPGERLFDVNDQTEAMGGSAPYYSRHDLLVSDALVARLREIAVRYPAQATYQDDVRLANAAAAAPRPAGAIAGLTVAPVPGTQEIAVAGVGPANLPVTLTLLATMSKDIPDVVLSRHQVYVGSDGRFRTSVSAAPGYFYGAVLTLVASSLPGVASASASLVLKSPNANVLVPADKLP